MVSVYVYIACPVGEAGGQCGTLSMQVAGGQRHQHKALRHTAASCVQEHPRKRHVGAAQRLASLATSPALSCRGPAVGTTWTVKPPSWLPISRPLAPDCEKLLSAPENKT